MSSDENTLDPGDLRTGTLSNADDRIPSVQVPIALNDHGIEISLSWSDFDSPYARWFSADVSYADDPDRTKYSYRVPDQLWFNDSRGSMALLGCRPGSMRTNIITVANATVHARRAVLGATIGADYSLINSMRSSIAGLRSWVGGSSITQKPEFDQNSRFVSESYELSSPPDIPLGGSPSVRFHYHWRTNTHDDITELHDLLFVESHSEHPIPWQTHEKHHRAIRDLLSISSWERHDRHIVEVLRIDDPKRLENGNAYQENWCPVREGPNTTHVLRKQSNYLIQYKDIQAGSFSAWFSLYDQFKRAIDPLISSLDLTGATIEVQIADVGIGLEALGYHLFREDEESRTAANNHSFKERLERIAQDLGDFRFFDLYEWSESMSKAYNGIKHVNREPLDLLGNANAWRQSILVFRSWLAIRLGVSHDNLIKRLETDSMIYPYVSG